MYYFKSYNNSDNSNHIIIINSDSHVLFQNQFSSCDRVREPPRQVPLPHTHALQIYKKEEKRRLHSFVYQSKQDLRDQLFNLLILQMRKETQRG